MKLLSKIVLSAGVALALSTGAFAQGRSFSSTPLNVLNADYSGSGTLNNINMSTTATVKPYLYIAGAFARDFVVDGWGNGTSSVTDSIDVYHNETLTMNFQNFGNPTKATGTGVQSIQTNGQVVYKDAGGNVLANTNLIPLAAFNGPRDFYPGLGASASNVDGPTNGHLTLELTRTITVVPGNGPGLYTNAGKVTISRS